MADFVSQVQTLALDATDIKHHITIMKKEMSKPPPDLEVISNSMNITSSYRNEKLYNLEVSLSDILSEFPALRVGRIVNRK